MLKKTITYTDYNGVERTEDFYFNLTPAEILDLEMTSEGGYTDMIQRIVNAKDSRAIIETFKTFLLKSYGKKSDDGRRFIKSPEISKEFEESPAFSDFYMTLAFDTEAASDFVNGLFPKDLRDKVAKLSEKNASLEVVK